jgi:hypothetical protein
MGATAGAVDDDPAMTLARSGAFAAGAFDTGGAAAAATSPALDFRDVAAGDFVVATLRLVAVGFAAVFAAGLSRADRRTHPIRATRTQPLGAELVSMSTAVPASSDATLFADALPFDRTTTERLPMRVVADDFCAVSRVRST